MNNNNQNLIPQNNTYPQNNPYCPEHGQCQERQNKLVEEVKELKNDVTKAKDKIHDIEVRQAQDREQIVTLYHVVDEIKDNTKEISNTMKALSDKMDKGFKEVNDKIEKQNEKQTEKIEQLKTEKNDDITKTVLETLTNKINKDTDTENKIKLTDRKEFWAVIVVITGILTSVVTYFIN